MKRKSVLLSFRFLGIASVGALTMALVCTFAPIPAQLGMMGAWLSIFAGLVLAFIQQENAREKRIAVALQRLRIPMAVAPHERLFEQYGQIADVFSELVRQSDPVLQKFVQLKLSSITEQMRFLAGGKIVFSSTESWRTVYEQILRSPQLKTYFSVSWVKSEEYWQDQPGRTSMRLNFELLSHGLSIQRIAIIRDEYWPLKQRLPSENIADWLREQHEKGVQLRLLRESEVGGEPELLCDVGIYGQRAVGIQELDDRSRTLHFTLHFDKHHVSVAQDRWKRLLLYAVPYTDLLSLYA